MLTPRQLADALIEQRAETQPVGKLAVFKGFLTMKQVCAVLREQAERPTDRFGEIAVELGFLTDNDIAILLKIQRECRSALRDILVRTNVLSSDEIDAARLQYHQET